MIEEIFDTRKIKTFSNCKELVKSMVGTRDGMIMYNEKFRLDLENTCYKADIYDELQQRIDKAIEYMKTIFMNCIDNDKRYFEDPYIQRIYEILKGDSNE